MAAIIGINPSSNVNITSISSPTIVAEGSDFESLTCNLDPSAKSALLQKLEALKDKEQIFSKLEKLITASDLLPFKDFFLDSQFEYYALAAVKEKRLSVTQFGTLMSKRAAIWDNIQLEEMQTVSLFHDNSINFKAREFIASTLTIQKNSKPHVEVLDQQGLNRFFEIMQKMPLSEQQFCLIPDRRQFHDVSHYVNDELSFNVFCSVNVNGKKMLMIPSYGMIQALLDVCGNPDGFKFKLVLCLSTTEGQIRSLFNDNAREIFVHCNETSPAPSQADKKPCCPITFIYHDLYHLWVCKNIFYKDRLFYCNLGKHFYSKYKNPIAQTFYDKLSDMEMNAYRTDYLYNRNPNLDVFLRKARTTAMQGIIDQRHFTPEEEVTAKKYRTELFGIFAVWKLYLPNASFEEIVEYYEKLTPEQQNNIGQALFSLESYIDKNPPFFEFSYLTKLNPRNLINCAQFIKEYKRPLETLVAAGVSYFTLTGLMPAADKFERVIDDRYLESIVYLVKQGFAFDLIANLDMENFKTMIYDNIWFANSGIQKMQNWPNLFDNPSFNLIISSPLKDLIKFNIPMMKLINLNVSRLEQISQRMKEIKTHMIREPDLYRDEVRKIIEEFPELRDSL